MQCRPARAYLRRQSADTIGAVYINRTLLLLLTVAIVFIPSAQEWAISGSGAWYRPYLIWALVIVIAWWNQHRGYRNDF